MTRFKYFCAIGALASLVAALLPMSIVPQHTATAPEWVGRAIYFIGFLLFGAMFYGLQTRRPIYWKLIPILMVIFLLSATIPPLWSAIRLSLPWPPFLFVYGFILIGALVFTAWWRNQRSYFA